MAKNEKALIAAAKAMAANRGIEFNGNTISASHVMAAVTDPELGLDRMVSAREVAQAFRDAQASWIDYGMSIEAKALAMENMGALAAAFVEREFGEQR